MTDTLHGRTLAIAAAALACCAGLAPAARAAADPAAMTPYRAETKRTRGLEVQALEVLWKQQPVAATAAGVHRYDDDLASWSSRARDAQLREVDDLAKRLGDIRDDVLRVDDRVDRAAVLSALSLRRLELTEIRQWERDPLLYAEECVRGIHLLGVRRGRTAKQRYDAARKRLAEIPRIVAEMRENVRAPDPDVARVAAEAFDSGAAALPDMMDDLARQAGRTSGAGATTALDAAVRAMQDAAQALRARPEERSSAGMGRDAFDLFIRDAFGVTCDGDSLLRLATRVVLDATSSGDSGWTDAAASPQQPPSSFGRDDILASYREAVTGMRRSIVRDRVVSIPASAGEIALAELPAYLAPYVNEPLFEPIGPFEQPNPGERGVNAERRRSLSAASLYVGDIPASLSGPERVRWYRDAHSGSFDGAILPLTYPGAHLQTTIAAGLVDPVRKAVRFPASAAGWSAYCEELAAQRDLVDPPAVLAMRAAQRARACRALAEIHVQRGEWSVSDAAGFVADRTGDTPAAAFRAVVRDLHRPGAAIAALVGFQQILAARERYRVAHRADYTVREFHDRFLECGMLPVPLVEQLLLP